MTEWGPNEGTFTQLNYIEMLLLEELTGAQTVEKYVMFCESFNTSLDANLCCLWVRKF